MANGKRAVTTTGCPVCKNHLYYDGELFIYDCPECEYSLEISDAVRILRNILAAEQAHIQEDNELLRRLLWLRHVSKDCYLYGDDGEMQCNKCMIDFKRDPVEKIFRRIGELNLPDLEKAEKALAEIRKAMKTT